eukprot:8607801-Alexandrium_andersonii.AAC.1
MWISSLPASNSQLPPSGSARGRGLSTCSICRAAGRSAVGGAVCQQVQQTPGMVGTTSALSIVVVAIAAAVVVV